MSSSDYSFETYSISEVLPTKKQKEHHKFLGSFLKSKQVDSFILFINL